MNTQHLQQAVLSCLSAEVASLACSSLEQQQQKLLSTQQIYDNNTAPTNQVCHKYLLLEMKHKERR
jgi:hypothetical protein